MDRDQRDRVRDLVMRYGWNATCYQTVNPVFEYSFLPSLDAVTAFVRARGRRVVAGSPLCAESDLGSVIDQFANAEVSPVLYFGAGERVSRLRQGGEPVSLGAQPVWNPQRWNERVSSRSSLCYQFRRATNKGVVVREWGTEEAENSPELRRLLATWLRGRGLPPLHFLVEPETLDYLQDRRTFVAEVEGTPVAFLNLCPVPIRNGWLTEQFPRLPHAPNGTIELLMHEAAQTVAKEGAEYLTMGLVPFSAYGEMDKNPIWLRALMGIARGLGSPLYNFRGLDEFKSKFNPDSWEPVYATVSGRRFGYGDLLAVSMAFTGEPVLRTARKVISRFLSSRRGR